MKKTVVLCNILIVLFILTGCPNSNNPAGGNMKDNEQALLEKEKKSLVQEKKHKGNGVDWISISITSKLEDTRTAEDRLNNIPPKNDIINTIFFDKQVSGLLSVSKKIGYMPSLAIEKRIPYANGKISFTLTVALLVPATVYLPTTMQPIQIKLSNALVSLESYVTYKPSEHGEYFHVIVCKTNLSITQINDLRLQENDIEVILPFQDDAFKIVLPKIFFDCLKEI